MATAGEGTSYGGGAGGKFRKKPFRRLQTTPYDRPPPPPTALVNPRNGWLSKLVDPASKLISASAHMFFSSVFRKRLPPPPLQPSSGANQESRGTFQAPEVEVPSNPPGAKESAMNNDGNPSTVSEGSGISELEQLLKQKTFTRYEIDRLTELLHSRTSDIPAANEDNRVEPDPPKPLSGFERHEEFASTPKENGIRNLRLHEVASTPVVSTRVLDEDVASPAELAKAYMGSRPTKVSPSLLGLRSQAVKEDVALLNNVPFFSNSPTMSVEPKSVARAGIPYNGFNTPRVRGRSAIYSMARTPYSRVYLTANQKGFGSANHGNGGPSSSSSRFALEHDGSEGRFGSKQSTSKRRSSVFEDDIGSVGPIRRIRQKTNLLSPKSNSSTITENRHSDHATEIGTNDAQEKLLLLDKPKQKVSKMLGEEDKSKHGTSFALVPSKSTETATKILQHLERLTPKEKSPGSKLAAAKDKSPSNLEVSHYVSSAEARASTSGKQDKVEENGTKTLADPHVTLSPAVNRVDTMATVKNFIPSFKNVDSVSANLVSQPPQKKWAFQMSAHEDYLELDDDVHSNGDASKPLAEEREKLKMPMVESKAVVTEAATVDKNQDLANAKPHAGLPPLTNSTDMAANDRSTAGAASSGFTFRSLPDPSTTLQPSVPPSQPTSAFDQDSQPKEPNVSPPLFSFGPKRVDKTPTFGVSAPSSLSEPSLKASASLDPKPESSNSFPNIVFGGSGAVLKTPESDKGDNKNTQKVGDAEKPVTLFSSGISTSTSTSGIFSFSATTTNSTSNNGSLASNSYIFSSSAPTPPSSNLAKQNFTDGSTHVGTSTTTTTAATFFTSSAATPAFSAAPIFNFGSSVASSSVSTPSTTNVQNTSTAVNTEKETKFGNLTDSPFGCAFSAKASTGSALFPFGASATTSTVNNQPQGPLFSTGSGSLGGTQASLAGTSDATIPQTTSVQFGSSNSAPLFSSSGTTLTSSSPLFGSSTPAANLFSSVPSFGMSSSAASSETNSISSSSGVTSSLFGSSWQPNKSPIFGSSSGSSLFNSPSTGFSFESSSSTSAAALSGSVSSFTMAAQNPTSSNPFSQNQPLFGNSTPVFTTSSGNNDQMSMEDTMAEDPIQAITPISAPSGFMFDSSAPSTGLFQFGSQQNLAAPQNPSPFGSGSLEFNAGGSFSLGSSGGDKSGRRIIRVKKNRKK